jgi:hypothetical protein
LLADHGEDDSLLQPLARRRSREGTRLLLCEGEGAGGAARGRAGWSRGGVGEEGPLSQPLARRNREGATPWLALLPALCLLRVGEETRERRNGG